MKDLASPKPLSIPELRYLAIKSSADELSDLSKEKLPQCIPTGLIEEVSSDKKAIVEDLILETSMHRIAKINYMAEIFGPKIHQVLTAVSAIESSDTYIALNEHLNMMLSVHKGIKTYCDLGLINEFYRLKNSSHDLLKDLKMELVHIQSLFDFTLEQRDSIDSGYADMLYLPAKKLQNRLIDIQVLITTYTQVCLCVKSQYQYSLCQSESLSEECLKNALQKAEKELEALNGLHDTMLLRDSNNPEIKALQYNISTVINKPNKKIIPDAQVMPG